MAKQRTKGPRLTVDALLDRDGKVLLIKRKNPPPGWALLGDLTNDGTVDDQDRDLWQENLTEPGEESPADLDRDGDVDSADLALLDQDWQSETTWFGTMPLLLPAPTPEPSPRR